MKSETATQLVDLLAHAYSRDLSPDTRQVYVEFMESLGSTEVAFETARQIIYSEKFFPAVATFRAAYKQNVARAAEQVEGQERRALEAEIVRESGELPKPVLDLLTRLSARSTDMDPSQLLVEGTPGACDDCDRPTERRFLYGAFQLCALCASRRLAVRIGSEERRASG